MVLPLTNPRRLLEVALGRNEAIGALRAEATFLAADLPDVSGRIFFGFLATCFGASCGFLPLAKKTISPKSNPTGVDVCSVLMCGGHHVGFLQLVCVLVYMLHKALHLGWIRKMLGAVFGTQHCLVCCSSHVVCQSEGQLITYG